jgi:hypothetical protein
MILIILFSLHYFKGIGSRGTRLSHEKSLNEDTMNVFHAEGEKKGYIQLPAGIHRFMFTFVVPNVCIAQSNISWHVVKTTIFFLLTLILLLL